MTKCKLIKGMLGATALTAFSAGTAFAQNDFTEAGTTVSNTFTLDYEVNDTTQSQITNTGSPTNFNVDRLVNVTVSSLGNTNVVADQDDALLPFLIVNNGNDDHAYVLDFEQPLEDFIPGNPTTAPDIIFYDESADTSGDGILSQAERDAADLAGNVHSYDEDAGEVDIPELAPDERAFVFVRQNIPAGLVDTNEGAIVLYANTQTIVSGTGTSLVFTETLGDTDGNAADPLTVENVLADENGPATAANDDPADGAHSARGLYIVENPNVTATKSVFGVSSVNPDDCDDIPASAGYVATTANSEYFTPNSCVEYVIEVVNAGTTDATNIDLTDILPENLTFHSAAVRGALQLPVTAPVGNLSAPAEDTDCDGTVTNACTVALTNATLASGSVATPTIGYLVIRAVID